MDHRQNVLVITRSNGTSMYACRTRQEAVSKLLKLNKTWQPISETEYIRKGGIPT